MLYDQLDKDQKEIYNYVVNEWIDNGGSPYITIGGYAGTGKTFLISAIAEGLREKDNNRTFAFCSYTGKATSVLNDYLTKAKILIEDYDLVSTIHGLIYKPIIKKDPETGNEVIKGWERLYNLRNGATVIFLDEGSMVNRAIWQDLIDFNVKILVFGDCFQLPPIGEDKFNLMNNPDFNLTNIHRQSDESRIIQLSKSIRNEGIIKFGVYSNNVRKHHWSDYGISDIWDKLDLRLPNLNVLCGTNYTRNAINLNFRKKIKYKSSSPTGADKIIGLKNNSSTGIKNGQQGTVSMIMKSSKHFYNMYAEMDGFERAYQGEVYKATFGREKYEDIHEISKKYKKKKLDFFDYAYAMTVHKSQASEWDDVVLFDQRSKYMDDETYARWLYTAVTRARRSLLVITDYWPKIEE